MEPVKTVKSNGVYRGDGEDVIDLHCEIARDERGGQLAVSSVWEPTPEEREQIFLGSRVKLTVFTRRRISPALLEVTDEEVVEVSP